MEQLEKKIPSLDDYWREQVIITCDRITLLAIFGASILALKHPEFTGPSAALLREALKQLVPLVCKGAPVDVLIEWDRILEGGR